MMRATVGTSSLLARPRRISFSSDSAWAGTGARWTRQTALASSADRRRSDRRQGLTVRAAALLEVNAELRPGRFGWVPGTQTITVDYDLLGDTLDRDELAAAVRVVTDIADNADESSSARSAADSPTVSPCSGG